MKMTWVALLLFVNTPLFVTEAENAKLNPLNAMKADAPKLTSNSN